MLPLSAALEHQAARGRLEDAAVGRSVRLFRSMDVDFLDRDWDRVAPAMVAVVTSAQIVAARQSAGYLERVAPGSPPARLVPEAFGGVTLSGREVGPEMYHAVVETKRQIGRGIPRQDAFTAAASLLAALVGSMVQDLGRSADMSLAVSKGYTRYVRMVSPGACSRCAILAGDASYREPFLRHPKCRCTSLPVEGQVSEDQAGQFASPSSYFESLSAAEQDRAFTKAGAEAIRQGADPIRVVNARAGYFGRGPAPLNSPPRRLRPVTIGRNADGSPLQVFATSEGTTVRGEFGRREIARTGEAIREGRYRRSTTLRLLPEQIVQMAGPDPARMKELLTRYGYLYPTR